MLKNILHTCSGLEVNQYRDFSLLVRTSLKGRGDER